MSTNGTYKSKKEGQKSPLSEIYKDERIEEFYRIDLGKARPTETRMAIEEPPEEERRERLVLSRKREAAPLMQEDEIEELRRLSPEIIGSLFDRVKFLKERIDEINEMMESREEIHTSILKDIDDDVIEKQSMIASITDMVDKRNVKLDISVLRKEKRSEVRQYWRDLMELRTELQELMEQHRNEAKIASLFKDETEGLIEGEKPK